jgi:RNA polymerase sigma-70 factor (ECF subfamily)
MTSPSVQSEVEFPPAPEPLFSRLYHQSGAEKVSLTREAFATILREIAAKYLPADAGALEREELFLSLRLEDLALARACAAGHEAAWEKFLLRFRQKFYDIAAGIADYSGSRELADSLYADLYGTQTREGQRVCKLASYTGRGSLEGWLRTVMAQEHINRFRRERRLVSLEEKSEDGAQFAAPDPEPAVAVDPRVEAAVDEALAALPAEERLMLAAYYLDGQTLAQVARTLDVHESTISRRLEKVVKSLRKKIIGGITQRGLSRRQAEEALDLDVRDLQVNIRDHLAQKTEPKTFPEKGVEAQAGEGPAVYKPEL